MGRPKKKVEEVVVPEVKDQEGSDILAEDSVEETKPSTEGKKLMGLHPITGAEVWM